MTCKDFNVIEDYKNCTVEEVNRKLRETAFPYAVLMQHIQGDFNIGTVIRNANAFNAEKVFYFGNKRYDRRGTVGTHHYTDIQYLTDLDKLRDLKKEYCFIGVDNTESSESIFDLSWKKLEVTTTRLLQNDLRKSLFLFGEENNGLIPEVLDMCDVVVHIPQFGSVRSLNVGTASGVVMYEFVKQCTN